MRLLRVIMLWWMVLALPMQGLASAAMLHCGAAAAGEAVYASVQQPADVQAALLPAVAGHADHDHDHAAHHAASDGHGHGDADGMTPGEPASSGHAAHQAGHACSACAACCVAMGLPTGMPLLSSAPAAVTAVTVLVAPAPSFLTAGPERPPRSQRT